MTTTTQGADSSPRRRSGATVASTAVGAATTAAVLVPELVGLDRTAPWPAITAFRAPIAAATAVLGGLAGLHRGAQRAPSLAVAAVAGLVAVGASRPHRALAGRRPSPSRRSVPSEPSLGTLRVLTFNVEFGRADTGALARAVRTNRPDIVVLPEAGDPFRRRLLEGLDGLGYRSWSQAPRDLRDGPEAEGPCVTVLCAARLGDVTVRPVTAAVRCGWLEVAGGTLGTVRVVAVHTVPPVAGRTRAWAREVTLLGRWLRGDTPAIVVGDLNATGGHRVLRDAARGAVSATVDCGRGRTGTWPSRWPRWLGVQIDHVLATPPIRPRSAQILDLPGSDHRAVLADLELRPALRRARDRRAGVSPGARPVPLRRPAPASHRRRPGRR